MKDMLQQAEYDWQKHKYNNTNNIHENLPSTAETRRKAVNHHHFHSMPRCNSYCRHHPYAYHHPPPPITHHNNDDRHARRERRFSSSSSCPSTPPTLYNHQQQRWHRHNNSRTFSRTTSMIPVIDLKSNPTNSGQTVYTDEKSRSPGCSCCT